MKALITKYRITGVLISILVITGCKTGNLKEQIADLTSIQAKLAYEQDSLRRLIIRKSNDLAALAGDTAELTARVTNLESKNNQLATNSALLSVKLKEVEYTASTTITRGDSLTRKNDSLRKKIESMQNRLTVIDGELASSQKAREQLIEDLKKEEEKRITDSTAIANKPLPVTPKNYGWFVNTTEIGGAFGLGGTTIDYSKIMFGLTNVFGYTFGKSFSGGVGTGVHIYSEGALVPLYLDFRYHFNGERHNMFLIADGGCLINIKEFTSSGLFIYPAIGYNRRLGSRNSMHVAIGPLIQTIPSYRRSSFVCFKGGVSFAGKRELPERK
ncbi:MAG: hypothetical protein FJY11_05455 [Bacteroidetes bacterium]|nr:hypothetical protein [Bacteroidota bacterium]